MLLDRGGGTAGSAIADIDPYQLTSFAFVLVVFSIIAGICSRWETRASYEEDQLLNFLNRAFEQTSHIENIQKLFQEQEALIQLGDQLGESINDELIGKIIDFLDQLPLQAPNGGLSRPVACGILQRIIPDSPLLENYTQLTQAELQKNGLLEGEEIIPSSEVEIDVNSLLRILEENQYTSDQQHSYLKSLLSRVGYSQTQRPRAVRDHLERWRSDVEGCCCRSTWDVAELQDSIQIYYDIYVQHMAGVRRAIEAHGMDLDFGVTIHELKEIKKSLEALEKDAQDILYEMNLPSWESIRAQQIERNAVAVFLAFVALGASTAALISQEINSSQLKEWGRIGSIVFPIITVAATELETRKKKRVQTKLKQRAVLQSLTGTARKSFLVDGSIKYLESFKRALETNEQEEAVKDLLARPKPAELEKVSQEQVCSKIIQHWKVLSSGESDESIAMPEEHKSSEESLPDLESAAEVLPRRRRQLPQPPYPPRRVPYGGLSALRNEMTPHTTMSTLSISRGFPPEEERQGVRAAISARRGISEESLRGEQELELLEIKCRRSPVVTKQIALQRMLETSPHFHDRPRSTSRSRSESPISDGRLLDMIETAKEQERKKARLSYQSIYSVASRRSSENESPTKDISKEKATLLWSLIGQKQENIDWRRRMSCYQKQNQTELMRRSRLSKELAEISSSSDSQSSPRPERGREVFVFDSRGSDRSSSVDV